MPRKTTRSRFLREARKFPAGNLLNSRADALKSPREGTTAFRVLGFDPGFERMGLAVLAKENGKETLLYSHCVRTSSSLPFPKRLEILGNVAQEAIDTWKPNAVALEEIYFEKNAKTAIGVAQVKGMLSFIAASNQIPVFTYTPLEVKVAVTGYGKSDKRAVSLMVSRLVALPKRKRLDDELDAIAVGLTCLASERGL